jgi:hypothetical protein
MASLLGTQGLPGAANPLGAITGAAPVALGATPGAQAQSPFQSFITGGIPVPKIVLTLLTIFPPTGITGLNLYAVNNVVGNIIKSLSYGVGILWGMYFNRMYPSTISTIISALMFLGPWYIFDIITILDNKSKGFESPIPISGYPDLSPYPDDGTGRWNMSPALISLILTAIPAGIAGGTGIANFYSPNAVSGDTQKYIGYATIATGGLLGAMSLYGATRTPASVPSTSTLPTAAPSVNPLQLGGGRSRVPSLSQIARDLVRPIDAKNSAESKSFLGILAIVFLGGIAIAVTRSKRAAKTSS